MSKRITALSATIGLAVAAIAALAPTPVFAQTMGEYGLATGHAAASASQMPAIQAAAPSIESSSSGGGSTHTVEVRGYDAPSRANNDRSKDDDPNDSGNSSQDWVQVK